MELARALEQAVACHRQGRLAEAEAAYRQILAHHPEHADATHLLGVIEYQRGDAAAAAELVARAIAAQPAAPHFHNSLGSALRASGRTEEAVSAFGRAVALNPDYGEAHFNLGNALRALGRTAEAEAAYRRSLAARPDDPATLNNLATLLEESGCLEEAESALRLALARAPEDTEVRINLASVLGSLGRSADAAPLLDAAAAQSPTRPAVEAALARALARNGRMEDAEAAYRRALVLDPANTDAATALGALLIERNRAAEAVPLFRHIAERHPNDVAAHTNLIKAHLNAGQAADAVAAYRHLAKLHPDNADVRAQLATCLLMSGELAEGFAEFEWRWRTAAFDGARFSAPRWDGAPMPDGTLLLHAEQGMGDAIQFIRYAPLVKARVGRLVVETYRPLAKLFESIESIDAIVLRGEPLPPFDRHLPLVSLPRVMRTELDSIPSDVPYLRAPPDTREPWQRRVPDRGRLRVGVVWAGSALHPNDANRSCPPQLLSTLLEIAAVDFYSLQTGDAAGALAAFDPAGRVRSLAPFIADFTDTAAALVELDLLVSVDTAPVHLAGALARPVWVMLPHVPDWRWLLERDDSPWYPTARLFRQRTTGDWRGVIERVRTALAERVKRGRGAV